MKYFFLMALSCGVLLLSPSHFANATGSSYGLSLYGDLKYKNDFTHFDYTNPKAPKGGTLRLSAIGTFDNLNPYITKGASVAGVDALTSISLMTQAYDEPFSMYGLLAESVERADDNLSVTFTLRKNAVWDDGTPITGDDVVWSLQTLKTKAAPFYRAYYADVKDVTTKEAQVTFTFATATNKELPLIIAQMPILPKHYWDKKDFSSTTLTPPLSGGPYKIGTIHAGQSIEYVRNPKWWGKDLNVNVGRYNFDVVNFTYYRDQNVALESFFAGNFDVQQENIAKLWATAYNAPAVLDGRIIKQEIANQSPAGMQAFIYNVRRPVFQDSNVRQALAYAFDFEWENRQFAFGTYQRTRSYFENSELSAKNIPTGRELELLAPYRGQIPDDVFTTEYHPPKTDGSGNNRLNLKAANDILDRSGYKLGKDGVRVSDTGTRLSFEMIVDNGAFERWILPFIQNLKKIGVEAHMRVIDDAQYQNRMRKFDYDMTVTTFGQSNSPGNEQREFWTSEKADIEGSRNMIGIKDPVIDDLVKNVISSGTRAELVANTRALDRVLQWNHFVIPNWFFNKWRLAWWSHLEHPEHLSGMTPAIIDTWWVQQK